MGDLEPTLPISQDVAARVPSIGMAAFRNDIASVTQFEVTERINQGVRVFEIAEVFANGHEIIGAINEAKFLNRSEIFVILKLWPKKKNVDDIIKSTKSALRFMGLNYVDLLMLDAKVEGDIPQFIEQWKAMEELKDKDITKHLGIANPTQFLIMELFKTCILSPVAVQLEITPFCQRSDLVGFCQDNSMTIFCYEPLSKGIRINDQRLLELSAESEIPPEQLLVRWILNKGLAVLLPPTFRNMDTNTLLTRLPEEVMRRLDSFEENLVSTWDVVEDPVT